MNLLLDAMQDFTKQVNETLDVVEHTQDAILIQRKEVSNDNPS